MARFGDLASELNPLLKMWSLDGGSAGARSEPGDPRLATVAEFGGNPGDLVMRSYTPARLARGSALVVVLHGCTQTAASFEHSAAWTALADEHGFAVLYPEQHRGNNPKRCFNWFNPEDVARGAGEAASIRAMVETMVAGHGLDRRRVFVTGLSAGGAMTSALLAAYPDVFAGGAIMAGLPCGAASSVPQAFESMYKGASRPAREWGDVVRDSSDHRGPWPKVSVWHGGADSTVVPSNGDEIVKQWLDVHGLGGAKPTVERKGGRTRRVWTSPNGEAVVEQHVVAGMSHGVALDARRGETPGPFMLDVGVSANRDVLAFWGLATASAKSAEERSPANAPGAAEPPRPTSAHRPAAAASTAKTSRSGFAGRMEPEPRRSGRIDVQGVIAKALKAAGLMK
ncbi:extracellular catalytic domain type 1 short-chain-length polyhydroxyalkanoate depolymerase [Methylopila sp. Yamaguchi]|uniref:extracellular catalytic domain type 1 short-chain-length polyhydroxyalkanoate depolymerase n=1 Tax=Methylopila sp. Yamaguchi TaxID=1437817 RepID=UPI000CABF30B|nr:PHB depolymerase family esterase [Methylopila sp. Yamaguchi]GBD47698.1 poly(3-hydroxyalkanoate) depolymerase [Methylopila sp. Yamaguchi]